MEKSIKVLICSENIEERKKISDCLIKSGKRIPDEADNGEIAVKMARSVKYDLIVVDLWLSGIDGIGVIKAVKSFAPDVSVILLSEFYKL